LINILTKNDAGAPHYPATSASDCSVVSLTRANTNRSEKHSQLRALINYLRYDTLDIFIALPARTRAGHGHFVRRAFDTFVGSFANALTRS